MAWFKLVLEGKGFPGVLVGQPGPVGFITTVAIEADTSTLAQKKALAAFATDKAFELPPDHAGPAQGMVHFEQVQEITAEHATRINDKVFWFPMDTKASA